MKLSNAHFRNQFYRHWYEQEVPKMLKDPLIAIEISWLQIDKNLLNSTYDTLFAK